MLISDLPLEKEGVKTKKKSIEVFEKYTESHVEQGVAIINDLKSLLDKGFKGACRQDLKKNFTEF